MSDSEPRLYTRFISVLRALQSIGYMLTVIAAIIFSYAIVNPPVAIRGWATPPVTVGGWVLFVILALPLSAIGCFSVYVATEGLIAHIDLLSRIEKNTRAALFLREPLNPNSGSTSSNPSDWNSSNPPDWDA